MCAKENPISKRGETIGNGGGDGDLVLIGGGASTKI